MAGVLLALDVGEKRVGVAKAAEGVSLALPLTTIHNGDDVIKQIEKLVKENQAAILVVGLPRGMEGQETAQTAKVREFAEQLKAKLEVKVELMDEAATSVKAEQILSTRKNREQGDVDALAASLILQDYIDNQ